MKKIILSSVLIFSTLSAYNVEDYRSLSLEELMNITVTSASRREESQNLAPGVVTVISNKEMKEYGARHLRDVLDRVVGVQVLGSHQDYHSKTSMRGFNSSHHEGHVLILLNSRPVRQATDGGLNSDFYLGFPINIIEHIEIIRGPGSVIYGTNAVTGVINIITKDAESSLNETQVDFGLGSFGREQVQVSTLFGDDDYSVNLGVNYIEADGDTFTGIQDQDGNIGDYTWGQESKNAVLSASYNNFTLNGMVMENNLDSANSAFQLPTTDINLDRYFLDVGYLQEITNGWDVSFNYTYQKDSAVWQIVNVPFNNKSDAESNMYEAIVRGKIGEDLNILIGGSYNKVESKFSFIHPASGLPTLPPSQTGYTSLYTQVDYMLCEKQKIIAGVQWNKPDDLHADFSPRLGFIQGFGESTWLKLLYSEAFRSPTFVETSLDAPQLKGNASLDAEKVETFDIQLINQTKNTYVALAMYYSKLDNQIVRTADTPPSHDNKGYVEFMGIELEAKYKYNENLSFMLNASYQENETNDDIEQSTFAPEEMVKAGVTYSGINNVTLSAFNSYIGESTDLSETTGDSSIAINPDADSYNLLTANIIVDVGSMFRFAKQDKAIFSLYLDNLLDEEVYAPDLNYANVNNTVPHHWGRGA